MKQCLSFSDNCVHQFQKAVLLLMSMLWIPMSAAPKDDLSSQEIAVKFFNKQAKLKPISTTDKEYSYDLAPKQDEKKGLWGYVDSRDKWILKPVFDEVYDFGEDDCAIVKFNGYWGVIDRTQSFCIVPFCTKILRSSVKGIFIANCPDQLLDEYEVKSYNKKRDKDLLPIVDTSKAKYLFIKKDGAFLNPDKYNTISDFDTDQLSIVSTPMGYGLLKSDGRYVFVPQFTEMSQYASGMFKVKEGANYGLVSKDGRVILPSSFDIIDSWSPTDLIWFRSSNSMLWGSIDKKGEIIITPKLDEKPDFSNSPIQSVSSKGQYGLLRKDGIFLTQCKDEYIKQTGDRFWVMRKIGHYGYYTISNESVNYIELPNLSDVNDGKEALIKYHSHYSPGIDSRIWLQGLKQASVYSALLDDKESSFLFEVQGHEYELTVQWTDTVNLHLKNLEVNKIWLLNFNRTVGIFTLDCNGNRRELYSNEYVFGTYDWDRDGTDELIIAMRDNSTNGWSKPSGGCYGVLKIAANGELYWYRSGRFSEEPVSSATISNGSIIAKTANISTSSSYPRVENFGLNGPVMTTGELSFNYEGYLTAIGGYHIAYDSDNNPRLVGNYGSEKYINNFQLAKFDQEAIIITYDIDCMDDGNYEEASEIWTFNSQGLLESYRPFYCTKPCQYFYVYDWKGRLKYEIYSRMMTSISDYQLQTAIQDLYGNWIEQEVIIYEDECQTSIKKIKRAIEYYTESESGK